MIGEVQIVGDIILRSVPNEFKHRFSVVASLRLTLICDSLLPESLGFAPVDVLSAHEAPVDVLVVRIAVLLARECIHHCARPQPFHCFIPYGYLL